MSRDMRHYTRQTNRRLIVGGLLVLFIIGDGLILIIYGQQAAILGLLCMSTGMIPILVIILALWIIDWLSKRAN